ncbi:MULTISPECIES: hypothetical protein [unclassified Sphingomonas]|uniref:hypothetical protein n=1 Tax=unclassified Sphingomonas TaxID=196159 RepID=UPI000A48D51B|nr:MULTISPECIES: hypothetical protein [unclassified Sphingomonas]
MERNDEAKITVATTATRKPWMAPALIASDVQDTANNQLPTFIESTTPTDRPS